MSDHLLCALLLFCVLLLPLLEKKMSSTKYTENGLNVEYVPDFIESEQANAYLQQLIELPFYQLTLQINGKCFKPRRKCLAYGDPGLSYAFSGTDIPAEPWTPMMIQLRDLVEKFTGCSYNYVLLNLYRDGNSSISHHRDAESCLDSAFPIAVLSFGAERTIEFKKPRTASTFIKLQHGSLYIMSPPTNKSHTHGIATDPRVKEARISLTFRHLLPNTPAKKLRLDNNNSQQQFLMDENTCTELISSTECIQQHDNVDPVLMKWNLNWNTFLQIVLDKNSNVRVYIRMFKENSNGVLIPTKDGISMTLKTWYQFQSKLTHFDFRSVNDSFICNNQLIVACLNEEMCILQQMFPLNTSGFFLKPRILKLMKEQFLKISEYSFEISEYIINAIFQKQLPKLLQNVTNVCANHLKKQEAKIFLFNSIINEIEITTNTMFHCLGCEFNSLGQSKHDCLTKTFYEKFQLCRTKVYLNLNLYKIIESIQKSCTCYFHDIIFFHEITVQEIENYMYDLFSNK